MDEKRRDYIPPIPQSGRKGIFSPEEREKLEVAHAVIGVVICLIGWLFFR